MMKHLFASVYAGRKVLVTGHTGFKGSWLSSWLLAMGARVSGLALDPQPHETLFDSLDIADRLDADHRVDVRDGDSVRRLVAASEPDFVFHLAAQPLVRLSFQQPVETLATNVIGTANLLDAIRLWGGPTNVVIVTTDKCYENREWLSSYRESDAMGGYDPYSASKGCAELVTSAYRRSFFSDASSGKPSVRVASARAGNVIGGGDWAIDRIVPDVFRALRDGDPVPVRNRSATRPWQHVLEPLSGYLWLAAALSGAQPACQGRPADAYADAFNFGPSLTSNRTVADVVTSILDITGGQWTDHSDPDAPHEASKLNLAIDRAFHLLGWQPVWSFQETIDQTVDFYWSVDRAAAPKAIVDRQIQDYVVAAHAMKLPWATSHDQILAT